jgi:hypothetical protein
MRITVNELRRIIKEEVENVMGGAPDPSLDADLASDIEGMVIPESRNRRPLREMDAGMAFGLGAGAAAGVYGLAKWGPAAYRSLREKISDWLDEKYYVKSVEAQSNAIDAAFEALNADVSLKELFDEYKESGDRDVSKKITSRIATILKNFNTGLSTQEFRGAMRLGLKPKTTPGAWMHQRAAGYESRVTRDERNADIANRLK